MFMRTCLVVIRAGFYTRFARSIIWSISAIRVSSRVRSSSRTFISSSGYSRAFTRSRKSRKFWCGHVFSSHSTPHLTGAA